MRSLVLHPFGLVLMITSLVLAGAMRFAPGLGVGSGEARWVLFWGLLAYGASIIGLLRSRPDVSAPEQGGLDTIGQFSEAGNMSERAIREHVRSKAIQHPAVHLPLSVAFVLAIYLVLLAPVHGGGLWAVILLIAAGVAAAGGFLWRYAFRYTEEYAMRVQALMKTMAETNAAIERRHLAELRETLQSGFARIDTKEGLGALRQLVDVYEQLQQVLESKKITDPFSVAYIPGLAEETYRRGLSVLADALDLMAAIHSPSNPRLEQEIPQIEEELQTLRRDLSQAERVRMREETIASHAERLDLVGQQRLRVDQLLHQAGACEASLHRTHIEIAALRSGDAESSVKAVVGTLRRTITQAKEVQDEFKRLGY